MGTAKAPIYIPKRSTANQNMQPPITILKTLEKMIERIFHPTYIEEHT